MSNLKNFLFTSESVSEGHPDKVSDRISDMVVDSYLSGDPFSRVACETLTTTNKVVLAGEVRGPSIKEEDLIQKVRECIKATHGVAFPGNSAYSRRSLPGQLGFKHIRLTARGHTVRRRRNTRTNLSKFQFLCLVFSI